MDKDGQSPWSTAQEEDAECAQSESYRHLAEGGLQIRLGDDSSVTTEACLHLKFSVGEKSHDWDYHVMTLPRGVDIIMGMDFMEPNDCLLYTSPSPRDS